MSNVSTFRVPSCRIAGQSQDLSSCGVDGDRCSRCHKRCKDLVDILTVLVGPQFDLINVSGCVRIALDVYSFIVVLDVQSIDVSSTLSTSIISHVIAQTPMIFGLQPCRAQGQWAISIQIDAQDVARPGTETCMRWRQSATQWVSQLACGLQLNPP